MPRDSRAVRISLTICLPLQLDADTVALLYLCRAIFRERVFLYLVEQIQKFFVQLDVRFREGTHVRRDYDLFFVVVRFRRKLVFLRRRFRLLRFCCGYFLCRDGCSASSAGCSAASAERFFFYDDDNQHDHDRHQDDNPAGHTAP